MENLSLKENNHIESKGDIRFGWYLVISGFIAWIASGILVLERLSLYKNSDHVTACDINPWVSCGSVMKSWQAELFGFPNPLIGIAGFSIVIAIGFALIAKAKFSRWFWVAFQIGITLSTAFIVWLISQAVYEIQSLCLYCMIVWIVMLPMFIYTTSKTTSNGAIKAPNKITNILNEWKLSISIISIVIIAAIVVLNVPEAFFSFND